MPASVVLRSFGYIPSASRFLFHSSIYTFQGVTITDDRRVGTLILEIRPQSDLNNFFPIAHQKIWGNKGAIAGYAMLSPAGVQNLFGVQPPNSLLSVRVRLRIVPALATRTFSFTEITNLGPNPNL